MAWENDPTVAFEKHFTKGEGCWIWRGNTFKCRGGYGAFTHTRSGIQSKRAHRHAYEIYIGPIAAGQSVLHSCDNPKCVSPAHLFLGSQIDNMGDKVAKSRQNRGETHGMRKLTEANVRSIRADTRKPKYIASDFAVTVTTIYDILRRRSWQHIP